MDGLTETVREHLADAAERLDRLVGVDTERLGNGGTFTAVTAAAELGVSARPVLMAVNVAATAALLTPIATPANLMVMEPGGYRFGDYWKLGLPLMGWYAVIAIAVVPLIWRF